MSSGCAHPTSTTSGAPRSGRLGWEDTAADLERLIRREAKHNEAFGTTRVAGLERRIDIALPGVEPELRLQGNIDRVDVGPGFAQIVDYKSGRAISRRAVESGDRLQLQLYALAAREEFQAERLIARYAYLDPRAEEWALDSANPADAELIEDAARHTEAVRSSVAGGDFRVNPQVPTCPATATSATSAASTSSRGRSGPDQRAADDH